MEIIALVSIIAGATSSFMTFFSSQMEKRLAKNIVNKENEIKVEVINGTQVNKIAIDYYETISEFSISDYMNNKTSKENIDNFIKKMSSYKHKA